MSGIFRLYRKRMPSHRMMCLICLPRAARYRACSGSEIRSISTHRICDQERIPSEDLRMNEGLYRSSMNTGM